MIHRLVLAALLILASPIALAGAATAETGPLAEEPSLPPVGRSLFDFLVSEIQADGSTKLQIPYPFEALKARIAEQLADRDGRAAEPKAVLVPLGRSLQRMAASPDYFTFPRLVLAIDEQPALRPGHAGLLLADRLFLGFQEVGGVIEVISYNEAAGRFEFQQVEDYQPGGEPYLVYVERSVCLACHQNRAPIFATAEWDETNANPQIAARLAAAGARAHGTPLVQGIGLPAAIDKSTDRANKLLALHQVWQRACGARGEAPTAIACRADALLATLQLRLSGGRGASLGVSRHRDRFAAGLAASWSDLWPAGLAIANPDLPNRELALQAGLTDEQLDQMVDPEGAFSAETPRPPLERWQIRSSEDPRIAAILDGFAGFLAAPDIARLDRHLAALPAKSKQVAFDCRLRRLPIGGLLELRFRCDGRSDEAALAGYVRLRGDRIFDGVVRRIELPGRDPLSNLAIKAEDSVLSAGGGTLHLALAERGRGLSARFSDGDRAGPLTLSLRRNSAQAGLHLHDEFAAVVTAVSAMVADSRAGRSDALTDRPLRRARVMGELFDQLGMAPLDWCCLDDSRLPPARQVGP